jgi:hypothetical protein
MGLEDCEVCEIVCRRWETIFDSSDRFGGHGVDVVGKAGPLISQKLAAQHSTAAAPPGLARLTAELRQKSRVRRQTPESRPVRFLFHLISISTTLLVESA